MQARTQTGGTGEACEKRAPVPTYTGESNADATDAELVARSREGDTGADELLYCRYKTLVRQLAHSYFLTGADRDDVIQEGMYGLFKAIRDYRDDKGASFKTFAVTCVSRQLMTAVRGSTRKKHIPLNKYVSIYPDKEDEDAARRPVIDTMSMPVAAGPENRFISAESMRGITDALQTQLTELEKDCLNRFLEGKSYQEIAKELGCGVKRVDNALQRVRSKLARYLSGREKE